MADVDGDAECVHRLHRLAAKFGQARRRIGENAGRPWRRLVVGQLHHADAEIAEQFDALDLAFEHLDGFEGEQDAELLLLLCAREIGRLADLQEDIGIKFDHALDECDLSDRVLEVGIGAGERGLDRVDAAVPHHCDHLRRERKLVGYRRRKIGVKHKRFFVKRTRFGRDTVSGGCRQGGSFGGKRKGAGRKKNLSAIHVRIPAEGIAMVIARPPSVNAPGCRSGPQPAQCASLADAAVQ